MRRKNKALTCDKKIQFEERKVNVNHILNGEMKLSNDGFLKKCFH